MPCPAFCHEFLIDPAAVDVDVAQGATVAVLLFPDDADLLAEYFAGQCVLRLSAERLGLLWRIDAIQTDLDLLVLGVEQGQRIPIGNLNHFARQRFGFRRGEQDEGDEEGGHGRILLAGRMAVQYRAC